MYRDCGRIVVLSLGTFLTVLLNPAAGVEPVSSGEFQRLHSIIKPKPEEEKSLRIPWQTNLWEARKKAAAEGKPILLWEMDGHPLGVV